MKVKKSAINDANRIEALMRTELMDTPSEKSFDRLTRLATQMLSVPVALVTLVDDKRQFFKSCQGLPEPLNTTRQTPLSHSFCKYVVEESKALVVADAREHPLVRDNLAIKDLNLIAYLGIPLKLSGGAIVGSFCAIDTQPHAWTESDIAIIADLTQSTIAEIELRATLRASERHRNELLAALDSREHADHIVERLMQQSHMLS